MCCLSYREAHVSELFNETVHDPGLIWLVAHLPLMTRKRKLLLFIWQKHCGLHYSHHNYSIVKIKYYKFSSLISAGKCITKGKWHLYPLTLFGPFLGPLPQELQEELLSWEVGLFHMSPSSVSHWLVDIPMSSPPPPQPSCIGLGPKREGKHTSQ